MIKVLNQKQKSPKNQAFEWSLQESNQGHTDFQSVALPTELRDHWFRVVQK